jgi:ubiquinone/menaquinone biosynthesis C-methylase UbiE
MESKTINPWDEMIKNPPEGFREYLSREKEFLENNISKADVVFDLGCGTGRTMRLISPICKKVIGIDNDKEAFEKGIDNLKDLDNAEIKLEDAEKMSFDNKSFDVVFIGMSVSNFDQTRNKILSEIRRILKDNGILLFSTYNEDALDERLKNYEKYDAGNYEVKENGRIEFNYGAVSEQFSEKQIIDILEKNNLKAVNIVKLKTTYLIKAKKEEKE